MYALQLHLMGGLGENKFVYPVYDTYKKIFFPGHHDAKWEGPW